MNEILDTLRSSKFISIDLKSSYLQIPLEENSKPITAFTVPEKGMYHSKRMPFGLSNAPETFQTEGQNYYSRPKAKRFLLLRRYNHCYTTF